MTKKEEKRPDISKRASWLLWGLLAGLLMVLMSAFAGAWSTKRALKAELATLEPMVTAALADQATLESELAYVKSDAYVEEWALTQARMARSDETLVIPVVVTPTPTSTPEATAVPTPTPTAVPIWTRWWASLKGDE